MKLFGVAASALLLVAGLGAPASADAEWYPPATDVTSLQDNSTSVSAVGINARGDVTASLLTADPWSGSGDAWYFRAAQRPARGTWTAPVRISPMGDVDGHSDIAVDADNNATIVMNGFGAADRTADGEWLSPVRLDPDDYSSPTQIEVDRSGNQTVVGIVYGAGWRVGAVTAVSRRFGQAWGQPHTLSTKNVNGGLGLGVDAAGTATAIWGQAGNVVTARRPLSRSWSKPTFVVRSHTHVLNTGLAVNQRGDTLAVWTRQRDRRHTVTKSAYRPAHGKWQTPRTIGINVYRVSDLLLDNSGRSTAILWSPSGDNRYVWKTISSTSGRAWAKPSPFPSAQSSAPHLELGPSGGMVAAIWHQPAAEESSPGQFVVAVRRPGRTWSTPAPIVPVRNQPHMVVDGEGRATVMWSESHPDPTESEPNQTTSVVRSTTFDLTGPRSEITGPVDRLRLSTGFPTSWETSDLWPGRIGTDVRYRSAKWNAGFTTRKIWKQNTAAASAPFRARPGQTYCFSARGHSTVTRFGTNVGPWSTERCLTTPVDDRTATANGRWKQRSHPDYYRSTYRTTRHHGDTLTLKNVTARQLDLLVATGPGNGRISVTFAGTRLGSHRLTSDTNTTKQVLRVKRFAKARTGTLKITNTSATGKPVRIDGIYASR